MTADDETIAARFPRGVPVVRVLNKTDLTGVAACVEHPAAEGDLTEVHLSAKRGDGSTCCVRSCCGLRVAGGAEGVYLARERHLIALRAAQEHLAQAADHAEQRAQSLDLFAEELRLAQEQQFDYREFTSDDLLG